MTTKYKIPVIVSLALLTAFGTSAPVRASEVDELKATVQAMQKSMEQMQGRIAELERENHKQKQHAGAGSGHRAQLPAGGGGAVALDAGAGERVANLALCAISRSEIRLQLSTDGNCHRASILIKWCA